MAAVPVLLAPTDMSDASLAAVTYAADLARRLGGRVVLFHVISPKEAEEGLAVGRFTDRQLADARAELLWWFNTFVPPAARLNVTVRTTAAIGHAEQEIPALAESLGAAMIVMATHGRTGLPRVVLGSVAEAVLRHASCPVLTIRTIAPAEAAGRTAAVAAEMAQAKNILGEQPGAHGTEPGR